MHLHMHRSLLRTEKEKGKAPKNVRNISFLVILKLYYISLEKTRNCMIKFVSL
jgi:hypothetical protein